MDLMVTDWIALNIGNSRLHWALFKNNELQQRHDTPHFDEKSVGSLNYQSSDLTTDPISLNNQSIQWLSIDSELWIASVVPKQLDYLSSRSNLHCIDLSDVPLQQLYPTLGIDRALAVWGALQIHGSPALVIDCGTALTFTGATDTEFVGGAIAPGVRLQFQALGNSTAALPAIEPVKNSPIRWARETESAIESGILNTLLAGIRSFIEDWTRRMGESAIVLTGGDAELIYQLLEPEISERVRLDLDVVFWGMRSIRELKH